MTEDLWNAPRKHFVLCYYCEKAVNATERGSVTDFNPENGPPSCITLVSCDNCGQALIFLQEQYGGDDDWDEMVRVWPGPVRTLNSAIPESLRAEHLEARKCFDAKAYTAAAVMVRRTLEGVCAENGVSGRNLATSLVNMHARGLLDPRLLEWAQALRVVGNEGAHFTGKQVSREDAADALALSEAMLDYLYVLTLKFDEFKTRREQRNQNSETAETDGDPQT